MGSDNYFDAITFFKERLERIDMGTGRVADHHAGRQMDNFDAILYHLLARVLYVPPGASSAGGETDQFKFGVRINAERPFLVAHRPETFSSRAAAVAVADDYSNPCFGLHVNSFRVKLDLHWNYLKKREETTFS
jgi:hypothetical protein